MSSLGYTFLRRGSNKKEQVQEQQEKKPGLTTTTTAVGQGEDVHQQQDSAANKKKNNKKKNDNIITSDDNNNNDGDDDVDDYEVMLEETVATETSGEITTKTPVGVTIAFLRHQEVMGAENEQDGPSLSSGNNFRLSPGQQQKRQVIKTKPSSTPNIKELGESAAVSTPSPRNHRSRRRRRRSNNGSDRQQRSSGSGHRRRRRSGSKRRKNRSTRSGSSRKQSGEMYKKPISSFRVFLEGSFLYLACLVLPSFIGYLYQNYNYNNYNYASLSSFFPWSGTSSSSAGTGGGETVFQMMGLESSSNNSNNATASTNLTDEPPINIKTKEMDPLTAATYSYGYWAYEKASSRLCPTDIDPNSYAAWLCPVKLPNDHQVSPAESIYSPDITQTWRQDVIVVAVTAIVLAFIRFILVRALAPTSLHDKASIHAMVRCKSIHLLSNDYQSTLTPTCSRKILSSQMLEKTAEDARATIQASAGAAGSSGTAGTGTGVGGLHRRMSPPPLFLPPLPSFSEDSGVLGLRLDDDDDDDDDDERQGAPTTTSSFLPPAMGDPDDVAGDVLSPVRQTDDGGGDGADDTHRQQREDGDSGDEDSHADYDDDVIYSSDDDIDIDGSDSDEDEYADDESSHDGPEEVDEAEMMKNTGGNRLLMTPGGDTVTSSSNMADTSATVRSFSRLYAAPRFATAVFRFLYSATASGLAYYWFASSHFWPWYLGGTGSTAKCWDLNGLAVTMDSDFDHRNSVLKNYFLWQASYHLHSWAFDLLLAVLTLIKRGPTTASTTALSPTGGFGVSTTSLQTATPPTNASARRAYLRSLLQHFVALVLIAIAYVFSSLRRLAAIAMFAFDVSSCFLHLLQICLNANESSAIKTRKTIISFVYYGLVLPSFVFMRFGVWPALWYSTVVESQNWFRQLESVLVPRASLVVQIILQCWILLSMVLSAIYFRRLCRQPHLQRILQNKSNTP